MVNELSATDVKPWFRQFWPWFLISLPATVVVAGFITLYIAHKHSDDLVADEYYKDGLGINQQLEKKKRADLLGVSATLHFVQRESKYDVTVFILGDPGPGNLTLSLSHPLESDRDFSLVLQQVEPGVYSGEFGNRIAVRWHWILDFVGATSWRLDGSLASSDFGDERFK